MNNTNNKSREKNKISRKKFERLKIIALLLWGISDIIGFIYFIYHINISFYIFFIVSAITVVVVVYIVKNRYNVLDK